MAETVNNNSGGNGGVYAILIVIVILIIGAVLYFGGMGKSGGTKDINVKVETPSTGGSGGK